MTAAERHRLVMELFDKARALPPDDRLRFIDQQCGDDLQLRADLESLLAHDEAPIPFLKQVESGRGAQLLASGLTISPVQDDPARSAAVASRSPAYKVLRLIAEGGMGAVYEARQHSPRRTVALKVIRAGEASGGLTRRLRQEAHILGQLQHPGIATVYDAGTSEIELVDGRVERRSFFAMELINGRPLDEYVSAEKPTLRQILGIFAAICDAVHFAHERGVIHRDLKPSNILIDEHHRPKILDFGVARTTNNDWRVATIETQTGQLIGTIPYMSPEQVLGRSELIDRRSDVYSLGVVLHRVLTGRLPYDLQDRPVHEAMRIIQHAEPTRMRIINRQLRGDVETIARKALEKEPARRYQTADALAADIRRYLRDQPVSARPPSTAYQLRKFARRHRTLVMSTAAVFLALLAGLGFATYGLVVAQRERNEARTSRDEALEVAQFFNDMLAGAKPEFALGRELTVREMLDASAARVRDALSGRPVMQARLLDMVGGAYAALGRQAQAVEHLRAGLALLEKQPQNAELRARMLLHLASALSINIPPPEGETYIREALRYFQSAPGDQQAAIAECLTVLAFYEMYVVKSLPDAVTTAQQAGQLAEHALGADHAITRQARSLENIARVSSGDYGADVETRLRAELARVRRREGTLYWVITDQLDSLGELLEKTGRVAEAADVYEAIASEFRMLYPQGHPIRSRTLRRLTQLLMMQLGQIERAEPWVEERMQVARLVYSPNDGSHAEAVNDLGTLAYLRGDFAKAEQHYRAARPGYADAAPEEKAKNLVNIAQALKAQGSYDELEELYGEALVLFEARLGQHMYTAATHLNYAKALSATGNTQSACPHFAVAAAMVTALLGPCSREALVIARDHARACMTDLPSPHAVEVVDAAIDAISGTEADAQLMGDLLETRRLAIERLGSSAVTLLRSQPSACN